MKLTDHLQSPPPDGEAKGLLRRFGGVDLAHPAFSPPVLVIAVGIVALIGCGLALAGLRHPWFPPSSFGNVGEWVGGLAAMAAVLALGHQLAIERQQNQAEIERRQHESDSTDFIRARSAVQRLITANPDHEDLQVIGDLIVISSRADYRFYLDLAQLLARWPSDWVYHAYPAAKLLRELQTIATSPSSHKEALVDPPDRYLALRQALLLSHRRNYWIWCTRGAPAKRDDPDFIDEGRKLGVPDFCLMELAEDASKWARVSYLLRLPPEFHAEHWDEIRQMEVGNPLEQQRPLSDFFTFPEKPPAYTIRPRDELMTYPPAVG